MIKRDADDDEDSKAEVHGLPEVLSATAMLLPSVVSLIYLSKPSATAATWWLAVGCCVHCPFSVALHLHRAAWTSQSFRTKILYRLDMSFIHFYAAFAMMAWEVRLSRASWSWWTWLCLHYHAASVLHIWCTKPMRKGKQIPAVLGRCAAFAGLGTYMSAMGVWWADPTGFYATLAFVTWSLAFGLFLNKALGKWTSMCFHLCLAIPQACMLEAVLFPPQAAG